VLYGAATSGKNRPRRLMRIVFHRTSAVLTALWATALWTGAGALALGQTATSPQVEARRNFTFASEDLMLPTFAPESEADRDLGVQLLLEPRAEYDPFTVSARTGYTYTSDANLGEPGHPGDHLWMAGANVSYLPILRGNLYGEATVRETSYRYEELGDFDFDAVDLGAGIIYVIRELADLTTFLRYKYTDLSGGDGVVSNFYRNHALETGLFKSHILTRNQHVYASFRSEISLDADPGFAKRDEHGLTLGYRITPLRKVKAELFHRVVFLDFDERERQDWNYATGAALSYNFTPNLYLTGHVSWTENQSNLTAQGDYETWNSGIRVGGYWRF